MPKTLRLYPRRSFVFTVFFILIRNFCGWIPELMSGVHAGAMGAKRQLGGAMLEQHEAVHKDSWHVATSQRRDVPTS